MHLKFENIRGYLSYDRAVLRGQEIEAAHLDCVYRWVVIALPNGRFAPLVICNNSIPGGPGNFLGERNVCVAN